MINQQSSQFVLIKNNWVDPDNICIYSVKRKRYIIRRNKREFEYIIKIYRYLQHVFHEEIILEDQLKMRHSRQCSFAFLFAKTVRGKRGLCRAVCLSQLWRHLRVLQVVFAISMIIEYTVTVYTVEYTVTAVTNVDPLNFFLFLNRVAYTCHERLNRHPR